MLTPAHCTTNTASTVFASIRILCPEIPVSRLAGVTDPAANPLLALTQLSIAVCTTASQRIARNFLCTRRVTAAFLTAGVVVIVWFALIAGQSIKGWLAVTLSCLLVT
jgi:hypothetical protein